jgi:hypothetical protein
VGPIESTFSASKSLTLSTSNGALNFDVNLSNDAEGEATQLKLFNNIACVTVYSFLPRSFAVNTYDVAHRFIRGNITLTSAKDGAATRFDIHARTSTSPLTLDVLEAPRNLGVLRFFLLALSKDRIFGRGTGVSKEKEKKRQPLCSNRRGLK